MPKNSYPTYGKDKVLKLRTIFKNDPDINLGYVARTYNVDYKYVWWVRKQVIKGRYLIKEEVNYESKNE